MKKSYSQKHPYISVILVGLLCIFMTALGSAIPQIIGLTTNSQVIFTTVFLVISIAIGIFIMKKSRFKISDFGFRKSEKDSNRKVWWYIPLVVIEILPLAFAGFSSEITGIQYSILLLFTIAVGFNEEIYFRGLAIKFMEGKGKKKAIIWSSTVFGILHIVNILNGKNIFYIVLQITFACLVGFVLAEIVSITKSLWICIIWHATHDYIANIIPETLDSRGLIILAIQVGILLVYAIYIWKTSVADSSSATPDKIL